MSNLEIGLLSSLILTLAGISIFFFFALRTRRDLKAKLDRYSAIIDLEAEQQKIKREVESLTVAKTDLEKEMAASREASSKELEDKKAAFIRKFNEATARHDALQRQINMLEETAEMMDFGVYRPHYEFTTSDEYKLALEQLRDKEKNLIKTERAIVCSTEWTVGGSKTEGRKMTKQTHKLMLRAFNGECDAALAKVRWDNVLKMEERIRKAAESINKSAEVNKSHITNEYLELKINEIRLTHELQEKIKEEKDEQRRIQEEMREEEKARRDFERAKAEAEKEEARYRSALEKAREEVLKAKGEKVDQLNNRIAQLEADLTKAQEEKARAVSMAQLTRSGYVYIISNIGSFGEDTFKIGMTRRLEPMDRIKELGDASVPFEFDVHAMVYSENAPDLERKLHTAFAGRRINLVNPRKEFFTVALDEIERWAAKEKHEIKLTKLAEARSFRESQAIRARGEAEKKGRELERAEETVAKLFDEED